MARTELESLWLEPNSNLKRLPSDNDVDQVEHSDEGGHSQIRPLADLNGF